MVYLEFVGNTPGSSLTLGPATHFRITGNFMRIAPDGTVVARYHNHFWEVQGQHFTVYRSTARTVVHFVDAQGEPSSEFGPFATLSVADGAAYADGELFARLVDESQLWHCYSDGTYWPMMIIASPKKAE